jgi:hypothetical protein
MAEARTEAQKAQRESDKERGGEAARRQTERVAGGRDGVRQAAAASKATAEGAPRSDLPLTECAQEMTAAWARYAEDVVRHTTEASEALLHARNFTEVLEVQASLLRNNMQAFLDQSARIAEVAGRMATRPFAALREAKV